LSDFGTKHIGVRARGWGGAAAPRLGQKKYFLGAKAKFFGQKTAAENGKLLLFIYLTNKNGIHSV